MRQNFTKVLVCSIALTVAVGMAGIENSRANDSGAEIITGTNPDGDTMGFPDKWKEALESVTVEMTTDKREESPATAEPEQTTAKTQQTTVSEATTTKNTDTTTTAKLENQSTKSEQKTTKSIADGQDHDSEIAKSLPGIRTNTKINKAVKKKAAKKVTITLKKVKGATGYVVSMSASKKFAKKNTVTKKFKKVKVTFKNKKIKANKKYYVKARTYVVFNKKTYYGKWSSAKKVKLK